MGVSEAKLVQTDGGLEPEGSGWFVLNAKQARWLDGHFGAYTRFEGDERFSDIGVHAPGQPACNYHGEDAQEAFLVSGECLLLIEGEERRLRPWDFVHCPPETDHIFVGAGDGPCLLLATGKRPSGGVVYPVSELARKHGASVERETTSPAEAYASYSPDADAPCPRLPW